MTTLTNVAAVAAQTLANMTKSSQMYSRAETTEPSNSSKTIIISTGETCSSEASDNAMTKRSSLSPTDTLSAPNSSSQLCNCSEMLCNCCSSEFEQTGSGKCIRYLYMNNDGMSSVPDAENEGENAYLDKQNNIPSGTTPI